MKTDPRVLRECLQGDCNKILRETMHVIEDEVIPRRNVCDIDVDAVLQAPMEKLHYGRDIETTIETKSRTPAAAMSRGFTKFLFTK